MWSVENAAHGMTTMLDEVDEDAQNAALEVRVRILFQRTALPHQCRTRVLGSPLRPQTLCPALSCLGDSRRRRRAECVQTWV